MIAVPLTPETRQLLEDIGTHGSWAFIVFFGTFLLAYLAGLELILARDYGKPHKWMEMNAQLFGLCTKALVSDASDPTRMRIGAPLDDRSLASLQRLVALQTSITRARVRLMRIKRRGAAIFLGLLLSLLFSVFAVSPLFWGGVPMRCSWSTVAPLWGGMMLVLLVFPQAWLWHTIECDIRAGLSRENAPSETAPAAEDSPQRIACELLGRSVAIWSTKPPQPEELKRRKACMLVSMKNRRFSKAVLEYYCRLADDAFAGGLITVVDRPYRCNALARGLKGKEFEAECQKLDKIARDVMARVRKAVRKIGSSPEILTWDALVSETPQWLRDEVNQAFEVPGSFRDELIMLSARSLGDLMNGAGESGKQAWARFLVEELPVLLYLYYQRNGGYVDVYPGECPELFWQIEAGAFDSILPRATYSIRNATPLVYVDVAALVQEG